MNFAQKIALFGREGTFPARPLRPLAQRGKREPLPGPATPDAAPLFRLEKITRAHARRGFTLTEIVLALAIIGVVFAALLGLLPAGLNASRQAADATVTAVILEDLHNRLQGQALKAGPASFSPAYFDVHGVYLASDDDETKRERIYRADVVIGAWRSGQKPAGTSSLRPITIAISWPVSAETGEAAPGNPKTIVNYTATALTGTDWTSIDPAHREKIEF